ncbi:YebC/PmpR family DNA-binding transcriptional regulator [Arthrobacter sp. VKM Ac-2550]|uniref:YebC/PmpR family DNA-binding transcriptional regulator n=1 Tax=Crystallibacter permensis TaxID=1938888 RepID=UPI002225F435|nr:YebC/PmpR family DNA-binding transcriptional regulator [Arthrobacter sp. VKM Ac-2550]MCW2131962.1 DNA-binding regulatory protein, YebC/PmpR family [Arthrobacter sp. VKM Ac-2550]
MSGHSKWATTKHKKAIIDARRAKSFAKLIKNIEVAARAGGADMAGNPGLELAVQKAKKTSVPNDNIDRAIKRGAGLTGEVIDYTEIIYEARGPQGSAVLIECLTDNKNRAASEVRLAITRNGGTIADPGSVAYMFARKGVVALPKNDLSEDDVLMAVLDAGAEEVKESGDNFEVHSDPTDLRAVVAGLEEAGIEYETDEVEFVPSMEVELEADAARKFMKLVDALEDLDDVQNVYSNADIPEEVMATLEAEDA